MKTEWFSSSRIGEKYCRISMPDRPDVYVYPKNMSNTYALCAVEYGSVDRSYIGSDGKKVVLPDGVAHFLEHKMFAEPDGKDAFEEFSALGADANAYTSYDKTVFLFNCTSNFRKAFAKLLNMITHPYFTDKNIKKEQEIIAQEIGMYNDDPYSVCYENMLSSLYADHPVRVNICGTTESISQITPDILYGCYRTFYNPGNMVIVVCGNVSPEEVAGLVENERNWGKKVSFERGTESDFGLPANKKTVRKMKVAMPVFSMGFKEISSVKDPLEAQRIDFTAAILERMLFSTSSSLYNEMYDKGLITSPISCNRSCKDTYAFTDLSGTAEKAEYVCKYIISHIENQRIKGLSYDDFVRCKRRRIGDHLLRFDSTEDIANSLVGYAFDGLDILKDTELLESVSFDEAEQLFQHMYREENSAVSYIVPME